MATTKKPIRRKIRSTSKRTLKRKWKRNLSNLSLQVMPKIKYATHRYAESTQLFITNTFSDQLIYSLNGMYDPLQYSGSGGGVGVNHQPYLFDQMNALYNTYCVLGAKVKVYLRPGSTANAYAMNVYGETSRLTSIQYTNSLGLEKPGVKIVRFNATQSNIYQPQKTMTFFWSAKKAFRAKDRTELISNHEYNGSGSSNPNTEEYLYLTYQGQQIEQTTAKLAVDVVIDYIVAWTDPKQPNQS